VVGLSLGETLRMGAGQSQGGSRCWVSELLYWVSDHCLGDCHLELQSYPGFN